MRLIIHVLAVLVVTFVLVARGQSPNVVLIMADDLGYHDLSGYGHPKIKTPVLDQLAKDGVNLTNFYAGATVCTPSRMALLTGAYPSRLGWTKGVVGYLMNPGAGLQAEALTMAEVFRSEGYATGMTGKWHLGDESPMLPMEQGFEDTFYIKRSNNQTTELWRNTTLAEDPFDNRQLTKKFTNEAVRFIREQKASPFFLYVPFTAPHFPVQAHPDWKGKSDYGVYGDVVEEMDGRIGEILNALDEENLSEKTIVAFLSDNGPEPLTKESKALPYRGKKWSALEGGTRVPCIFRFPKVLPKGETCEAMIAAMDLFPTLASACGIDLKKHTTGSPVIDGVDVWETLLGKSESPHPRNDLLYWHGKEGLQAIRQGDWKLFLTKRPKLYDLANDAGELNNLSSQHPERVRSMRALAKRKLAEINAEPRSLIGGPPSESR
ncbi:sulfatase-like hydrolase/transferase [Verrucomicrobiales bacterium]|nr:sulfatase-like hydrolase/transferase [Verrucomicrobiales bacterium]